MGLFGIQRIIGEEFSKKSLISLNLKEISRSKMKRSHSRNITSTKTVAAAVASREKKK